MDRRRVATVAALAAVGGALAWLWLRPEAGPTGRARKQSAKAAQVAAFTAEEVPTVIGGLAAPPEGEAFDRPRTNLFIYEKSPEERAREEAAAEEARRRAAEEAEKRRGEEEERARRAAEAAEEARRRAEAEAARRPPPKPAAPVPPDFRYQYVGNIGPRNDALAILADGSSALSYARAGDTIDAAFRVERVGKFNLDISFTDVRFAGEVRQVQMAFKDAAGAGSGAASTRRPSTSRRN